MRQIFLFVLLFSTVFADNYVDDSANRVYKNLNAYPSSAWGISMDLGYTNYQIDVISVELNRAIDYNILEFSLGGSYAYGDWLFGIVGKTQVEELESNVIVEREGGRLNDLATINRSEVALYMGYKINDSMRLHALFRESKLKAEDSYVAYIAYDTEFDYQTDGLALSWLYHKTLFSYHAIWSSIGLDYSRAKVSISERVNSRVDDAYIDDSSYSLGYKLGVGYNYLFSDNIILKLGADYYKFDFGALDVSSKMQQEVIEKAYLTEETYSMRCGIVYRF